MISVRIAKSFNDIEFSSSRLTRLVRTVCRRFNLSDVTVGIAVVDDSDIRRLNRRFLNRSGVTDCLSFDLSDAGGTERTFELVVNGSLAARRARRYGHIPEAEMALYITHGLLHNLGFDDDNRTNAARMHNTEDEILKQFGFGAVFRSSQ